MSGVGSNMHSKEIELYKDRLTLTKRQREILVGTLLGDGHLETLNQGRTYRLKIEHSIKQKEYVDWLYKEFNGWVRGTPYTRTRTMLLPEGSTAREITSYGFTTYSHSAFRFYAAQFYTKQKRKTIPKFIGRLLTPVSLAIWFMDDGSWKSNKHSTYIIHTLGYERVELEKLIDALSERFNIETTLHKQKQNYWRLYVLSESAGKFEKLIEPYVVPSMHYKLGNKNA